MAAELASKPCHNGRHKARVSSAVSRLRPLARAGLPAPAVITIKAPAMGTQINAFNKDQSLNINELTH